MVREDGSSSCAYAMLANHIIMPIQTALCASNIFLLHLPLQPFIPLKKYPLGVQASLCAHPVRDPVERVVGRHHELRLQEIPAAAFFPRFPPPLPSPLFPPTVFSHLPP